MHPQRRRLVFARDGPHPAAPGGRMPTRSPPTLYGLSLWRLAANFETTLLHRCDLQAAVTDDMRFDLFLELFLQGRYDLLAGQLCQKDNFLPLLGVGEKRTRLHAMVQCLVDRGCHVHRLLTDQLIVSLPSSSDNDVNRVARQFGQGINFASFLIDAGWYETSERLLRSMKARLERPRNSPKLQLVDHECEVRLLHSLTSFSKFSEADVIYRQMVQRVPSPEEKSHHLPSFYTEFSYFCFLRSQYSVSFSWAMEAVRLLDSDQPPRVVIDVLRQASKACVVRRMFGKAEILIQEAVLLAKEVYGERDPKYADCLTDYGFYLLNVDSIAKSLQAYQTALEVRIGCFGGNNLRVAFSHEDLAYATYVKEYNTGRFKSAKHHAERALDIMSRLLPANHLLLASSQRVLALILEEIAIDESNKQHSKKMLQRAEELHLCALELAINAFGEMNVQTSKHYGNLGRLYQSMERFDRAEEMHLKAIEIKERLLGRDDYEVALSIGHLASLYNYDLKEYAKAEGLYLRSIAIGLKLFGPSYSGLEYDYRGLIRVYQETQDWEKGLEYTSKLRDWKQLRDRRDDPMQQDVLTAGNPQPISKIISSIMQNVDNNNLSEIFSLSSTSVISTASV